VRALYESDELRAFVGRALEIEPIFRSDDPLGALNLMYYGPGDELGWHFDSADFVVTLMLQAPAAGGSFEFVPMLRSVDDRNDEGVRDLLEGRHPGVRTMSGEPGHLAPSAATGAPSRHAGRGLATADQRRPLLCEQSRASLHAAAYPLFYGERPTKAWTHDHLATTRHRCRLRLGADAGPRPRAPTSTRTSSGSSAAPSGGAQGTTRVGAEFETGTVTIALIVCERWDRVQPAPGADRAPRRRVAALPARSSSRAGSEFMGDTIDSGVCHQALFRDPDGNVLDLHHRYAPRD
jgi:hypothetical protein